jgi:hypothetical protein
MLKGTFVCRKVKIFWKTFGSYQDFAYFCSRLTQNFYHIIKLFNKENERSNDDDAMPSGYKAKLTLWLMIQRGHCVRRYRCVLWGSASKNKSASAIQVSLIAFGFCVLWPIDTVVRLCDREISKGRLYNLFSGICITAGACKTLVSPTPGDNTLFHFPFTPLY